LSDRLSAIWLRNQRQLVAETGFTLIVQEPALRNLAALQQTPAYWGFSETQVAATS
jgi:hypothetical protein